ncbi:hypothetical protein MN202_17020 [Rheinheimera muenzenbergensis]|uniref:Helix-turn-helix n=1 Tax=Rheinheimera muenzenbergensis TaxID=1193628 RepID=A0ABU8CAS4_9GAMM
MKVMMISLSQYLDELKQAKDLKNDAELARYLDVSRAYISQVRSGAYMGESQCFELANMLGREPLELLSLNRAIRNVKDQRLQDYWLKIHKR